MNTIIPAADCEYFEIKRLIDRLLARYSFLSCRSIGRSCAGRDIFCLSLGKSDEHVLITAATHGSEHITANIALLFAEQLCAALEKGGEIAGIDARKAMLGRSLLIVPLCNPDGCEISVKGEQGAGYMAGKIRRLCGGDFTHWNANLRGVDINHNFSAGWRELHQLEQKSGIFGPGPTRFGGPYPESEPETRALTSLCRENHICHAVALHTQGEVIYWSYGEMQPPHSAKMAEIFAAESGYALDVPTGLAVGGGFKDWFISEFSRPGFTVEIGKGQNPLPAHDLYRLFGDVLGLLTLSVIM
ncbi:MAG: M14 family metallocarboxypeptidase [Clostridia bacterium]|nr:M14 family metallocarboxypeptidase [Clostridia bacterium]